MWVLNVFNKVTAWSLIISVSFFQLTTKYFFHLESGISTKIKFKKILAKRSAPAFTKQSTSKVDNVVKRSLSYDNKFSQGTNKLLNFEDKVSVHNIVRRSVNETNTTSDEKCSLTCIIIIAACGAALLIFCLVVTIYYATCKYTGQCVQHFLKTLR